MNVEHRTEVRVLFQGEWVGIHVANDLDALEYIQRGIGAGNSRSDYSVEKRSVVVVAEEWTEHLSWRAVEYKLRTKS